MLGGVFHEVQDLGGGGFAEGLGGFHAEDAGEIDTARENLVLRVYGSRDGLARERHGVQGGVPLQDDTVHRHFLTGLNDNDFALLDGLGGHGFELALALHMGRIRADVHEMGNRLPAPAFGDSLEQFAHLEEQHHEHRLRELRLRPRQEADDKRPDRCDGHEEVLVQRFAMGQCLDRLLDGLPPHDEVRDEVNQKVSPCGPLGSLLDNHGRNEQHGRRGDLDQRLLRLTLFLFVVVVMVMAFVSVGVVAGAMGMIVGMVMFVVTVAMAVLVMIRQILSSVFGLLRMTVARIVNCVFTCFCSHSVCSPCHSVCSPCHSVCSPCHSERSEGISPLMMIFVYHGLSYFHDAKIHPPPCNRVAIDTVFLSSLAFRHL